MNNQPYTFLLLVDYPFPSQRVLSGEDINKQFGEESLSQSWRVSRIGVISNKKFKSFTLLELLLVIVIISIAVSLSAPLLKEKFKKASFKSFVNRTYFLLDYAKTRAILKNIIVEVNFELEKNNIFLIERENKDKRLLEIKIPENIHLRLDKEKIHFYPDGTLEEFKLTFLDNEEKKYTILSKGFDGKIKINAENEE